RALRAGGPGQAAAGRVVANHASGPDKYTPAGAPGQTEPCWCPLCCLCLGALRGRVARGVGDYCPPAAAVLGSDGGAAYSASLTPTVWHTARRAGTRAPATS